MFSRFQLLNKYLFYYLHASSGKGHGIHSPFVYDFIKNVLNDKNKYADYKGIESKRKELLEDTSYINVEDFGAGSGIIKTQKRQVKKIASSSLKPKKYAQLLYRIVQYYKPKNIVELGTSFGITTAYLASGHRENVYTLEGATAIADIAGKGFSEQGIQNIELLQGSFDTTLPLLISRIQPAGLVFIDGHHKKQPTINYFQQLLGKSTSSTIFIFDDIHWSREMEEAWMMIKADPSVTLTIDLFFIGIVLLRKDFKVKQHFTIRF